MQVDNRSIKLVNKFLSIFIKGYQIVCYGSVFFFILCNKELIVFVDWYTENLALGKPTNQSSTYRNALIGAAESERAVDGNADTDMHNKHCSHTNQDNTSWWRVDLALDHTAVYEIHIVNRFTGDPAKNNVDYKITFGECRNVVFLKRKPRHTTWR